MRPLEEALLELSDRAESLTDEVLIARIETQLSVEAAPPHPTPREEPTMTVDREIKYETPKPQPPPRRWRGPVVALGTAAIAIGAVVGIAAILGVFNEEDPATPPSPAGGVATTAPSADTTTTTLSPRVEAAAIAPSELLTPQDLPARLDWIQPLPPGTGIWETMASFREREATVWEQIILHRCPSPPVPESYSLDRFGESWLPDSWQPWVQVTAITSLQAVDVTGVAREGVGFGQVVYAGTPVEVAAAAAALRDELEECLAVERVGEFDGETVDLLEVIPIGRDGIAVRNTLIMGSPPIKDIFRMAIVPHGPRLAIIEEHEGVVRGEPVITDEEFADVIDAAITRLPDQ